MNMIHILRIALFFLAISIMFNTFSFVGDVMTKGFMFNLGVFFSLLFQILIFAFMYQSLKKQEGVSNDSLGKELNEEEIKDYFKE